MIRRLVEALTEVGVDADAEAIADALWLARARRDEFGSQDHQVLAATPPAPTEPRPPDAEPQPAAANSRTASMSTRHPKQEPPATIRQIGSGSDPAAPPITLRRSRALPEGLELGRALRPLKQGHPSKRNLVLDAEATVGYFCDTGVLTPVMRPGAEQWFDLDVLDRRQPLHGRMAGDGDGIDLASRESRRLPEGSPLDPRSDRGTGVPIACH